MKNDESKLADMILQRLAWRELALRFLNSFNPQPDKAIVIANAIVEYDGEIGFPMRYHAHGFVQSAYQIIEHEKTWKPTLEMDEWLMAWKVRS